MRAVLAFCCLGLALAQVACAGGGSSGARLPWLHTEGTAIVDAHGKHVRLSGFNQGGMYEGEGGNAPDSCGARWHELPESLFANLEAWGFNSLRLHISWSNLEPAPPTRGPDGRLVHRWNVQYLQALDRIVATAAEHHVYVIPVMTQAAVSPAYKLYDGHTCEGQGMPSWLFPDAAHEQNWQGWCHFFGNRPPAGVPEGALDGLAAAWQVVARRYARTPAVAGFDLLNEPGSAFYPCAEQMGIELQANYLDAFNRRMGVSIHKVNPRALLFVEDSSYTEGPYGHFLSGAAGLRNVVYEWHNYSADWAHMKPALVQQLRFAQRIRAPLFLGEFSAFDAGFNDAPPSTPSWRADLAALMRYLRSHDVSWSMQNYDSRSSIIKPGTTDPKPDLLSLLRVGTGSAPARASRFEPPADDAVGATPGSAWPCFTPQGFTCSYARGMRVIQQH